MRDHAIVSPRFWTGETGKQIRELGSEAQCLALYLLTCPSSNMIGLYYLPMPILCHELGISREGASKGLLALSSVNYAHYDPLTETVFVPKMSMHQLSIRNGDSMNERDKRLSSIHKQLETYAKSPFAKDFLKLYKDVFHIPEKLQHLINGTKPRMGIEGASKGLRRGFLKKRARKGEQEQEQEQDKKESCPEPSAPGPPFIQLPTNKNGCEYVVTSDQVREWEQCYQAVDVADELRKMRGWLLNNKTRRKTSRGMLRFVSNWLGKAQDQARASPQKRNRRSVEERAKEIDEYDTKRIH